MKIIVNSEEMKCCDKNTIEYFEIPSLVLMERAALSVVEEIEQLNHKKDKFLIVCGTGNNGGDGLGIARLLFLKGYYFDLILVGDENKLTYETKHQLKSLKKYGVFPQKEIPNQCYDIIIDCIFGISLSRDVCGEWKEIIDFINDLDGFKIAVDIPSGVNTDTGAIMQTAIKVDLTITFAFQKLGNVLFPGCEYAGKTIIKDIGITKESFLENKPTTYYYGEEDFKLLPQRKNRTNKGTFGKVLVVSGCKNMAGAAFFSGKASYVSGCGLVNLFTEDKNRVILQTLLPEAILTTYKSNVSELELKFLLEDVLEKANVVTIGPGLSQSKTSHRIVEYLIENVKVPIILDADGLNIIAEKKELLHKHKSTLIITPHIGEMSRLCKKDITYIQNNMISVAKDFADLYNVICILKDARTIIAIPNDTVYINMSGNNGMASAGSGDVLTGVIAGFIAQGMDVKKASSFGVYLHGCAGDYAKAQKGIYGMTATDLLDGIINVIKEKVE